MGRNNLRRTVANGDRQVKNFWVKVRFNEVPTSFLQIKPSSFETVERIVSPRNQGTSAPLP